MDEIIRQLKILDAFPLSAEQRERAIGALQILIDGVAYDFLDRKQKPREAA